MEIQIISPQKTKIFKEIEKVSIPALNGQLQVLFNHAETFSFIKKGVVILQRENTKHKIKITNGEVYIQNNLIKIII